MAVDPADQKWFQAIGHYLGGGVTPYWFREDGTVDAQRTIDWLMEMFNIKPKSRGPWGVHRIGAE